MVCLQGCKLLFDGKKEFMEFLTPKDRDVLCWIYARGGYCSYRELSARVGGNISRSAYRLKGKGLVEFYDKKFQKVGSRDREFIELRCTSYPGHSVPSPDTFCRFRSPRYGYPFFESFGVFPVSSRVKRFDADYCEKALMRRFLDNNIIDQDIYDSLFEEDEFLVMHINKYRKDDIRRIIDYLSDMDDCMGIDDDSSKMMCVRSRLAGFLYYWGIDKNCNFLNRDLEIYCASKDVLNDDSAFVCRDWGTHSHNGRPNRYLLITPSGLDLCDRFSVSSNYVCKFLFSKFTDRLSGFCDYLCDKYGYERKSLGGFDGLMKSSHFKYYGGSLPSYRFVDGGKPSFDDISFSVLESYFDTKFAFYFSSILLTLSFIHRDLRKTLMDHPYIDVKLKLRALRDRVRNGDKEAIDLAFDLDDESEDIRLDYESILSDVQDVNESYGFSLDRVLSEVRFFYRKTLNFDRFVGKHSIFDVGDNKVLFNKFFEFIDFLEMGALDHNFLFCPCKYRRIALDEYGIEVATRSRSPRNVSLPGSYGRYI